MKLPSSIVFSSVDARAWDNLCSVRSTAASVLCLFWRFFLWRFRSLFFVMITLSGCWNSLLSTLLPFMNQWWVSRAIHTSSEVFSVCTFHLFYSKFRKTLQEVNSILTVSPRWTAVLELMHLRSHCIWPKDDIYHWKVNWSSSPRSACWPRLRRRPQVKPNSKRIPLTLLLASIWIVDYNVTSLTL